MPAMPSSRKECWTYFNYPSASPVEFRLDLQELRSLDNLPTDELSEFQEWLCPFSEWQAQTPPGHSPDDGQAGPSLVERIERQYPSEIARRRWEKHRKAFEKNDRDRDVSREIEQVDSRPALAGPENRLPPRAKTIKERACEDRVTGPKWKRGLCPQRQVETFGILGFALLRSWTFVLKKS
jgi:hypothetical protein